MPSVEERLTSLEARVDAMSDLRTLIAELRTDTNARFAELRADMNARFTVVDGRIGSLTIASVIMSMGRSGGL